MLTTRCTSAKVFSKPNSNKLYTLYWSSSNILSHVNPNNNGDLVSTDPHYEFNAVELKVTDFRELNPHSWFNSRNEYHIDKCYRIILK